MSVRVVTLLATTSLLLAAEVQAQDPRARPQEVTDSAVAWGRELFHGVGGCSSCHGVDGTGTDSGPALEEGVWMHGPDTYEAILLRVLHGVPRDLSTRDVPMPMRGVAILSDAEVRLVAAYVWMISHQARPRD
jgi:cytochrome c oxidase cbb3-type subunit III